jgi:hypothetical protein
MHTSVEVNLHSTLTRGAIDKRIGKLILTLMSSNEIAGEPIITSQ